MLDIKIPDPPTSRSLISLNGFCGCEAPCLHHAKFDIHHIYGVLINPIVKIFDKPSHLTNEKCVNFLPWIHSSDIQIILRIIFLMHVATIQHLNYSGQESQTHNLQFIFLTHPWPWSKVKVIKPKMTIYTRSKGMIMQSLKDLVLMMSEKKPMLKFFLKHVSIKAHVHWHTSMFEHVHTQKIVVYSWSAWCNQILY